MPMSFLAFVTAAHWSILIRMASSLVSGRAMQSCLAGRPVPGSADEAPAACLVALTGMLCRLASSPLLDRCRSFSFCSPRGWGLVDTLRVGTLTPAPSGWPSLDLFLSGACLPSADLLAGPEVFAVGAFADRVRPSAAQGCSSGICSVGVCVLAADRSAALRWLLAAGRTLLGLVAFAGGPCSGAAGGLLGQAGGARSLPGAESRCLRRARRCRSLSAEAWRRVTWPAAASFASLSTSGTPVCSIQGHLFLTGVTSQLCQDYSS